MKTLWSALLALVIFVMSNTAIAHADGGYLVQYGDTLASIAQVHGVSLSKLAQANGLRWDAWVFVGQWLSIPSDVSNGSWTGKGSTYTVKSGDTLSSIAAKHGVSMTNLQTVNGLSNANYVYVGQRLTIPGSQQASWQNSVTHGTYGEKWIDVNLTNQTITAYEGNTPVMRAVVSTGTWQTPTVVGTFKIYTKHDSLRMTGNINGDYWDIPNVPDVMFFYEGYGFHGTYWHNNFGTPMSHGCVNLSLADAEWLYNWATVGTKVVSHY